MKVILGVNDAVVSDSQLLRLVNFGNSVDGEGGAEPLFDVEYAMNELKADPALGARLLQLCGRNNSVFWNGDQAGRMGVRVIPKPNSIEAAGTNLFGFFLADVRKEYLEYISENPVEEIAPAADAGRVVTDYFPSGEFDSEIALREKDGHKFIHVDYYRPKRFQFDANLSGTTGHAMRDSDSGVATNTFVCPFGTDYHYKVRVGSAAEASYLYESGIRGELDYNALLTSLEGRGLVGKMRPVEREALIRDLRGQFDWMREQICTDSELRRRDIVDVSALVPDDSFGRSVYDMYTAPSPGHVLSRYIQNPGLLFSASENSVLKALAERRKGEPERFEVLPGKDVVRIAVVGSDTIGGRQVGRKAVERSVLEAGEDEGGRQILKRKRRFDMPMKSDADISADYAAFAARMDSILAGVPEGTRVELWTGGVTSDKSRTGTARMAERYVNERNGNVLGWNFETEGRFASRPGPNNDISVVSMDFFNKCYPVLLGLEHEAEFYMDAADLDSLVTFKESPALRMDGVVCFTVAAARDNSVVDTFGSMAARVGVPLVHVSENRSEQEQRSALASASQSIYSLLTGNQDFGASLFAERPRDRWDVNGSTILSNVDTALSLAVPVVMQPFEGVVPVGSVSYHTPFGAFVAMLAQEAGRDTIDDLNSILRSEERPMLLLASYREYVKGVSPEVEERCMRRAVRMMSVADTRFSSILTNAGGDIVLPDSLGETRLFVDLDGNGENRFGVVLGAERDYAAALVEERRIREEKERQEVLEENARRQKLEVSRKAPGEKVRGGLPERPEDFQGAVWLIGTSSAPGAEIQDGNRSFVQWDDMNGQDPLVREMVTRQTISDGEGGQVPNNFVFLYPTNLAVFTGKDRMYNRKPSSRELHDCERTDPETGQKFVCAYGIPVKMNKFVNEPNNEDHFPCSFRMDDSAADFVDSIVLSDALARTAAIRHKASLCAVAREGNNGELWFPMSYVFGPKAKVNGKWTDSPHAAPVCARNLDKYLSMLYLGRNYPLNCIPLPSDSYDFIPGNEESKESALRRLISDVLFSLKVANATALQLNVPLRVPLDQDGRIDLGPGIPEEFRDSVERRVNSFIGAVNSENLAGGPLPVLERASILDYSRYASQMKIAQDLYLRPNDLALAFGRYDFRELRTGGVAPLHEMFFRMEDGTFFDVRDAALNRGKSNEEVSDYIKYEKNDLRRFVIRTNNPDKAEEFTGILKSYIDRAKKINVEYRLLMDSEKGAKDLGMEGFIVVRSSNDRDLISSSDVGPDAYTQARKKLGGDSGIVFSESSGRYGQHTFENANAPDVDFTLQLAVDFSTDDAKSTARAAKDSLIRVRIPVAENGGIDMSHKAVSEAVRTVMIWLPEEFINGKELGLNLAGNGIYTLSKSGITQEQVDEFVCRVHAGLLEKGVKVQSYRSGGQTGVDAAAGALAEVFGVPVTIHAPHGWTFRNEKGVDVSDKQAFQDRFVPKRYASLKQKLSQGTTDKAPILVGRETTIFNSVSHFDGTDNNGYDGWEDARDGFRGYVQIRYTLPDGSLSEWQTLTDPELVKPVTMFTLNRKYNTDGNDFIINDRTLKMFLTAEAVRMSGDRFRMMDVVASKVEAVSKEVDMKPQQSVPEAKAESHEKQPVESAGKGKVYVSYWGNRSIPEDAFLVQISTSAPKGLEADARLESAYPDYKEMVAPHKDGVIDDAEYTRRYHESVLDPNRERIVNEVKGLMEEAGGKDIYLMCYCRPGAFCHRYLLNNFLNENGIECQECPEDRIKYTEGHVRLYGEKDYVSGSELIPQRQMSEPSVFDPPVPEDTLDSGIVFSESSGRYAQRTFENANAPDVDFTLQLAVDFSTAGEKSTARAAKDSLISVRIPVAKNGGIDMSRKAVSEAVRTVIDTLPEEFINGEEIGLNLAGNGIYTLSKSGITQEQVDEFVCRVHAGLLEKGVKVQSYRSGGQTGVDAAAGALAEVFGVPVTIHAPHGWTFRNEKGADVSDKQAFQDRFVPKRYASLKQKLFPAAKKSQGKTM